MDTRAAADAGRRAARLTRRVYLAEPPRRIPWTEAAGLVAFSTWDEDAGDTGQWLARLVVVRPGEDCLPGAVERRLPGPDQWGAVVELHVAGRWEAQPPDVSRR